MYILHEIEPSKEKKTIRLKIVFQKSIKWKVTFEKTINCNALE